MDGAVSMAETIDVMMLEKFISVVGSSVGIVSKNLGIEEGTPLLKNSMLTSIHLRASCSHGGKIQSGILIVVVIRERGIEVFGKSILSVNVEL